MFLENLPPLQLVHEDPALGVRLMLGPDTRLLESSERDQLKLFRIESGSQMLIVLEVPLGDADGFWHPAVGSSRTLVPDWSGAVVTSLVNSTPMGCLFDSSGTAGMGFALDYGVATTQINFGVSEERASFLVSLSLNPSEPLSLALLGRRTPFASAVSSMRDWLTAQRKAPALSIPELALEPVYSTWYAFHQDLDQEENLTQAIAARDLGCRTVFIDDGWQRLGTGRLYQGCGDWVPDTRKFPNLAKHVDDLHAEGLGVVLWIAPMLVGPQSEASEALAQWTTEFSDDLGAAILDPRFPGAREAVIKTCARLMSDYHLDGLKVDFLNNTMVYADTPVTEQMDYGDVGEAMRVLLEDLVDELAQIRQEGLLLEFRQPYANPSIEPYANLFRAGDCPGDAVVNRRSIIDARLSIAAGVVHSDMMMWELDSDPTVAARQMYNSYFAVPQLSVVPTDMPLTHANTVKTVLDRWLEDRSTVLQGELILGPSSESYPTVIAQSESRTVIGIYQPRVVTLNRTISGEVTILNATATEHFLFRVSEDCQVIGSIFVPGKGTRPFDEKLVSGFNVLELEPACMVTGRIVVESGQ